MSRLERERPHELAALLLATCGIAPFFAAGLRRHPERIQALLCEDPSRPLEAAELAGRLERALQEDPSGHAETALRRFKYYELARITLRDCGPLGLPLDRSGETLAELSQLADALLACSLRVAMERVEKRFGPPEWQPTRAAAPRRRLAFCVIGLGKLGGSELNFSSDVDLVYVHESARELASDLERPSPAQYFTRLAQTFGTIVGALSDEGFLYRIDLDLRPSGAQGPIVVGEQALASYYEQWADTWERATFTKARPVAGDLDFGWRVIRAIAPMIYLSSMDYAAVHSIRELKEKFEHSHGAGDGGFDVKLDRGGIREVEFVAQAMQLLHGARIPQLRTRSTLDALKQLARVGLVEQGRADALSQDYLYLRRIENRLQMEGERQVHVLPRDPKGLERLARAVGHTGPTAAQDLAAEIEDCRGRVHETYESVLADSGADGGVEAVLEVFARGAPQLMSFPATRRMVEELAARFAREIGASGDHEHALNNLDRFVVGIGRRRFYYELLLDRPELVPRLAALFGASNFLSSFVASHPRLIEPLFDDPGLLLPSREALREELIALSHDGHRGGHDPGERHPVDTRLDGLRLFHHKHIVNVGLLDLADLVTPEEATAALSDIAELCVQDALDFAHEQLSSRPPDPGAHGIDRYAVVAMGKLATRELTYGGDLDLIFVFDVKGEDGKVDLTAQDTFVRLTQRFISILQTRTREGFCYEIDARLRPSGNQGTLVTSLDAFARYHDSSAQTWERQALLRARAVAGDPDLATSFEALRREILERPLPDDAASEIHRVRQRMETELARETPVLRNFKTGRGGVLDVETIAQWLQLRHGADHTELLDVDTTEVQLTRLAEAGLLSAQSAAVLREGWRFLGRLSSRLRIVDNRSIQDLDQERGDLEGLARRLGYASPGRKGGARRALLADYERHTRAIRAEYQKVFAQATTNHESNHESNENQRNQNEIDQNE